MNSFILAERAFSSVVRRQGKLSAEQVLSAPALFIDAILVILASLASGIGFHLVSRGIRGDISVFLATGVISAVLYCGFLHIYGTQNRRKDFSGWGRLRSAIVVWSLTFLFMLVLAFGLKISATFSRGTIFSFYAVGMATVCGSRLITPRLLAEWTLTNAYRGMETLIVAPRGDVRAEHLRMTLSSQGCGKFCTLEFDHEGDPARWVAERRRLVQAIYDSARSAAPGAIYIVPGYLTGPESGSLVSALRLIPRAVYLVPDEHVSEMLCHDVQMIGSVAAVKMQKSPLNKFERLLKRAFDVAVSGGALVFCAPLLVTIAIAIKLDSAGPAFFRQTRHGYRGQPFRIMKFRSMTVQEDGGVVTQATRNDKRVTKVGAFLRKSSLDELPQLWNVLVGHMSIIGPRPHAVAHDKLYCELIENYEVRQHVRPGITGWAQVNGLRGETTDITLMHRRIDLDIWYATNCSLLLDMRIFFRTFFEVLRQTNAY